MTIEQRDETIQAFIDQLVQRAKDLYRGVRLAKRSSAVTIAETFGKRVTPYHGLTTGGYTGDGECGAIVAGRLVLSEFFADADPKEISAGPLLEACTRYNKECLTRIQGQGSTEFICNSLIAPFDDYDDQERLQFCTDIIGEVTTIVAQILIDYKKLDPENN